ncbi:hypothetical protein [Achromobacter xylosoxidans]
MALVSMRQLLDHAAEHGYGIPASTSAAAASSAWANRARSAPA